MVGLPSISTKLWDGQIHSKRQRFVDQAFLQPLNPETPRGARRQDENKSVTFTNLPKLQESNIKV